jgi:TolA-binding protein
MKYSLLVTIVALFPLGLLAAEPSAFGAGDLNNPRPYGLTPSEQVILQTKKKLHTVEVKSNNQANKVDSLRERIDGIQTIIEGLGRKAHENKINIKKLERKNSEDLRNLDEYEKRLSDITSKNSKYIDELRLSIVEIKSLLSDINTTYVTKDEFNNLVTDINNFKDLIVKELKKSANTGSDLNKMSKAEIETKAKRYYDKKHYTKAIEYYSYLIDNNYRPARAHYMIGEMKYYRKNYAEAIAYFKKSASLYNKASYMPILLLHTARAMQLTGDKKNAKSFYNAILSKYPTSKYAKEAKKYLSLIK